MTPLEGFLSSTCLVLMVILGLSIRRTRMMRHTALFWWRQARQNSYPYRAAGPSA